MKIGEEIPLVAAVYGSGRSSYDLDADYYKQKFLALAEWLKAREEFYDRQACSELDKMSLPAANTAATYMSAGNATKCARMWIRNHVILPEAE